MFRTGKFVVTVHRLVVALGWRVGEGGRSFLFGVMKMSYIVNGEGCNTL